MGGAVRYGRPCTSPSPSFSMCKDSNLPDFWEEKAKKLGVEIVTDRGMYIRKGKRGDVHVSYKQIARDHNNNNNTQTTTYHEGIRYRTGSKKQKAKKKNKSRYTY